MNSGNNAQRGDQNAVKRQFGCDEEMQRLNEGNYENQNGPEQGREYNGQFNQEHGHQFA